MTVIHTMILAVNVIVPSMYTDFYVEAANKSLTTLPLLPGEIDQEAKAVHEYATILIDLAILSKWAGVQLQST